MEGKVLDIKDIQSIVEEGLKVTKGNWDAERTKDQTAFDAKVAGIITNIEEKGYSSKTEVEAHVKSMQDQFDLLAVEMKKKGASNENVGFKQALAEALKENHAKINSVEKIKGNSIIQFKDITYADNFAGLDPWRTDYRNDIIGISRDLFHLRDIIAVGATNSDTIKYPRELAKSGSGPAPWGRGASIAATDSKPLFEPNMDTYTATVEWIAGIMRLPVEMLSDLPFLTSYLQQFAQAELLEAEDNQILNGNGTSPQLDGLITNATAYNGTYTTPLEVIVDAAFGQLAQANLTPTHLLLNPRDVVSIILNKATTSGEYNLPGGMVGFVNGQLQIAGLDVRKTNKITADSFLLGDFTKAQIFQRMAPQLRFFEQDQDNVIKNLVTVRIEERIALAILKTAAFVKGDLTPLTT